MSDYPMLISNKLHSFRNFERQIRLLILKIKVYVHRVNTGNNEILHHGNKKVLQSLSP